MKLQKFFQVLTSISTIFLSNEFHLILWLFCVQICMIAMKVNVGLMRIDVHNCLFFTSHDAVSEWLLMRYSGTENKIPVSAE